VLSLSHVASVQTRVTSGQALNTHGLDDFTIFGGLKPHLDAYFIYIQQYIIAIPRLQWFLLTRRAMNQFTLAFAKKKV
jgi:hypothetical protein